MTHSRSASTPFPSWKAGIISHLDERQSRLGMLVPDGVLDAVAKRAFDR